MILFRNCILYVFASIIFTGCPISGTSARVALVQKSELALHHVLDPLSPSELQLAIDVLREEKLLGEQWYLQTLSTAEPDKTSEGLYPAFATNTRKAFAIVVGAGHTEKYECIIDLEKRRLESKTPILKGEPALLWVEEDAMREAALQDDRVIAALQIRNITDVNELHIESWAPGDLSHEENIDRSHRFVRGTFYLRQKSVNAYARPIEGINVLFDATDRRIVSVTDSGFVKLQPRAYDFFNARQDATPLPSDLASLQPDVHVAGREVTWGDWKFRFQVHPREGLVLYAIARKDNGQFKSILDRVSLSEMIVPYADPTRQWYWKAAFDEGEYGVGLNGNSLLRGVHFPTNGLAFDAELADNKGDIFTIANAVAIFERDSDVAWSHYDAKSETIAARRSKELRVLFFFTVGNYDYGLQWIFRQDGSLETQVLLTGVLLAKGNPMEQCGRCQAFTKNERIQPGDRFGTFVDQNLVAIAHQHFFNFRLDFSVAGGKNSVAKIELDRVTDENPFGNAFLLSERLLKTENEAIHTVNHSKADHWWIFNRNEKNSLGHFAGYVLEPAKTSDYFAAPDSSTLRRAPFLQNNFYVTQFSPKEMHAAGDYPSQNEGDGLPVWIQSRNASIDDKDIVVWYTVGVTHLPFAEDWPVMPVHRAGFMVRPMGFHERNPMIRLDEYGE